MTSKEAKKILNKYRNRNYNSTFRDELELAKAIDNVLPKYVELEKRDTPMEVIKEVDKKYVDTYEFYERDIYKCGACKKTIVVDKYQKLQDNEKTNYCHYCGQRLDWSNYEIKKRISR